MFFLLRCVFWLGLVYVAMARDAGAFDGFFRTAAASATRNAHAARSLDTLCEAAPKLCLKAAEHVTGAALEAASRGSSTHDIADLRGGR